MPKWTEQVRDFKIDKGKEAHRITILNYHKIIDISILTTHITIIQTNYIPLLY